MRLGSLVRERSEARIFTEFYGVRSGSHRSRSIRVLSSRETHFPSPDVYVEPISRDISSKDSD